MRQVVALRKPGQSGESCLPLHKTVVLVTHDLGEAGFLGDTLVLMQAGRIVQQDTFDNLLHAPADAFVTRFINAQRPPLGMQEGES